MQITINKTIVAWKLGKELTTAGINHNGMSIFPGQDEDVLEILLTNENQASQAQTVVDAHNGIDTIAAVGNSAFAAAAAVPDWATRDETWILNWLETNIGTPLAAPIPVNPMTVQQIRAVLVSIVTILGFIFTALKANARMVIALRNKTWPNLQQ